MTVFMEKLLCLHQKQCLQVPKQFRLHGKSFVVQAKTMKAMKVLALKCFVLYGRAIAIATISH